MRTYSAFFQTLHDEVAPTGHLGRGTHYSVLRAVVFHDAAGKPLPEGLYADFAVIWDEDHDDRVIEPIERIYRAGLLPSFIFFGERKGMFTAILDERARDRSRNALLQAKVNEISQGLDDPWTGEVVELKTERNPIISDSSDRVTLYLKNIDMLWQLGTKKPEGPRQDNSLPLHVLTPERRRIVLTVAKDERGLYVTVALEEHGGRIIHYRGHASFATALTTAQELSVRHGCDGYYDIEDGTASAGHKTFSTAADWQATLTEIDRQLKPLKEKSGLDWLAKGGRVTPADLMKIPPVGPQLAALMDLRASIQRRKPNEI